MMFFNTIGPNSCPNNVVWKTSVNYTDVVTTTPTICRNVVQRCNPLDVIHETTSKVRYITLAINEK